jgi:hypothetical protein
MDEYMYNISNLNNNNGLSKNEEEMVKINEKKIKRRMKIYREGKWKKDEHEKFLELFSKHGSNWPKVNVKNNILNFNKI